MASDATALMSTSEDLLQLSGFSVDILDEQPTIPNGLSPLKP